MDEEDEDDADDVEEEEEEEEEEAQLSTWQEKTDDFLTFDLMMLVQMVETGFVGVDVDGTLSTGMMGYTKYQPFEPTSSDQEPTNINKKKLLGETNHFCPVALQEAGILYPGNPENAAKYREKVFFLSTPEAKEKFVEEPHLYVPTETPIKAPPLRLLIVGAKGSGKSLHSRQLANKLGIFHIQFKERLQELIIHKTKKKIGPEYEEEQEPEEEAESGDEDDDDKDKTDEGTLTQNSTTEQKDPSQNNSEQKVGEEEEDDAVELTEDEELIKNSLETDESLIPEILDNIVPQWWHKEPFKSKSISELIEDEELLNSLETDESLIHEILDNIVPQWWHKEPFKSTGFILEGFPRNMEEARYLGDMGLFPDAVVFLQVEDTDVIARLLPPKMDKWREKRDKKLAKRQKKKEKAQKKRGVLIEKRRAELLKEREEKKAHRKYKDSDDDDESKDGDEEEEEDMGEEEEEDDLEAILAEEFEEEEAEEEEDDEPEEDAEDRMRNDLEEVYDNDTNRLSSVMDTMDEMMIPRVEIDAARRPHIARYLINKQLRKYIDFRDSLFERVYPISEVLAKRMLQVGYKQPSVFGRWCPVKLKTGDCIQPMSGPGYPTFPCIYRQQVYFLSSKENRNTFINNPITYLRQPAPKPVVPIKIAVIGPPKSGKTSLARRFSQEHGVVRLSIGDAIRLILENPRTQLSKNILKHIQQGHTVPDELGIEAVRVALMEMQCQTRGYVLDGFPVSKAQVDLMTERHIIPVKVIELTCNSKQVMLRGTQDRLSLDRQYIVHDSAQILNIKLAALQQAMPEIRDWYKNEHQNFVKVDGENSKWKVWRDVVTEVMTNVRQIQTYLQRIDRGKAASIADMCVTGKQYEARMGDFGHYCPVSLATKDEFVDNSTTKSMKYAAEFRGHYYKMHGPEELAQFLATPEVFVPPQAPTKLPTYDSLPHKVTEYKPEFKPELLGFCPVSYLDGKLRYEALLPGHADFEVRYLEKYYYMESEEKMDKFMRNPEKYCHLALPHKLPCKEEPEDITSLPLLGYLEQGVCTAIIKAMTAAGNFKPKYPFMSPSKSALIYIAYHLKAYNPRNSDYIRKKYKQKLANFEESCRLIQYLGDTMTVRYKEPPERPNGFDNKLETFFGLRQILPTSKWIA